MTARGDVTIDPRRQQLIGVRTAPVMREPLHHALGVRIIPTYDRSGLINESIGTLRRALIEEAPGSQGARSAHTGCM